MTSQPNSRTTCVFCEEKSQGPGCCEASLRAELWRLEGFKERLRKVFNERQTPALQGRLLTNQQEIDDVRETLIAFEPEPPKLSEDYSGCLKIPQGCLAPKWRGRSGVCEVPFKHKPGPYDRERILKELRTVSPIPLTRLDLTDKLDLPYIYSSELLAELEIPLNVPGIPKQE